MHIEVVESLQLAQLYAAAVGTQDVDNVTSCPSTAAVADWVPVQIIAVLCQVTVKFTVVCVPSGPVATAL